MSVTQKAISARIKFDILEAIEKEMVCGTHNRNEILNDGAKCYLDLLDSRREYRMFTNQIYQKQILFEFLKKWFPEAIASKNLDL